VPAIEAIEQVEAGESLGTEHTVRGDPEAIEALLDQFRDLGLALEVHRDETEADEAGERVVELRKRDEASTDKIEYFLGGGTIDE
jgi:putative ATP-dependent DNA ligase